MKILKIKIDGVSIFSKTLEVNFFAQQKVSNNKNEMLTNIFSNIYTNNIISMIGINASGKTTSLKAISFVLQMLANKPINSISSRGILQTKNENDEIRIESYFYDKVNYIYKLETYIKQTVSSIDKTSEFIISNEFLYKKSIKSIHSKKDLFNFTDKNIVEERANKPYLLDDVSIIIGLNKINKFKLSLIDSINWTNLNGIRVLGEFPIELIKFLDPSIEYLRYNKNNKEPHNMEFKLKFSNRKELILNSSEELETYLSSGTIKGINTFLATMIILKEGGYLIVDELENHFNIEIVSTLIRLFIDKSSNSKGATIIFSTHYIELLDELERNDCIYITSYKDGVSFDNLSTILKRNDIKKSEWFKSGYLEYTTPSYKGYIDFKRKLIEYTKGS